LLLPVVFSLGVGYKILRGLPLHPLKARVVVEVALPSNAPFGSPPDAPQIPDLSKDGEG
jgi:hypothetical protein